MNFIWFTLIVISNLFLLCFGSDKLNVKSKPIDNLYKRVCVYPNWTVLRPKKIAKLFPDEIDPYMCTHIHYAYANINVRTLELVPSLKQDTLNGSHGAVRNLLVETHKNMNEALIYFLK
jgi:GH18 family chitinase